MIEFNYEACLAFFIRFVYNKELMEFCKKRGFKRVVHPYFEKMSAELLDENKYGSSGYDLTGGHEVKSARLEGVFKWDCHPRTGLEKIQKAHTLHYLFYSYSADLELVEVRVGQGGLVKDIFDEWEADYTSIERKSRKQYDLKFEVVKERFKVLMVINEAKLIFPINIDKEEENMIEFTKNPEEYDNIAKAWLDQRKGKVEKKEETPPQDTQEKDEKAERTP